MLSTISCFSGVFVMMNKTKKSRNRQAYLVAMGQELAFFLWQVDPHFKNMHTRLCYVDSLCVSFSTSKAASTEYILYTLISCLVTESSMNEAD